MNVIKSPSDTTIYVPALAKGKTNRGGLIMENLQRNVNLGQPQQDSRPVFEHDQGVATGHNIVTEGTVMNKSNGQQGVPTNVKSPVNLQGSSKTDIMGKIYDFVDQLRLDFDEEQKQPSQQAKRPRSAVNAPGLEEAQRCMEQALIETEKFKAAVEKPPGRNLCLPSLNCQGGMFGQQVDVVSGNSESEAVRQVIGGSGISDDDFFHLTYHIEPSLKRKIENGEYIDLDKLLPKDNTSQGRVVVSTETKLEWVQSEGSTYLVPAKSTSRINCFWRWEQAFRMYATIYCTKNPNHAREIWQYISVIHIASMAYNWDNVYNYDIVFCQLMEFNPSRSWAVTYNQMWNLSMTNPIMQSQPRRSFGNSTNNNNQGGSAAPQKRKIDYCWGFNKGVKCKFGKKCKFIERCSYCDDPSHGVINCSKLDKKDKDNFSRCGGRKSGRSKWETDIFSEIWFLLFEC